MFPSMDLAFSSDSSDCDNDDTRLCRRNLRDALNVFSCLKSSLQEIFVLTNTYVFKLLLDEAAPKLKVRHRNTHILPANALATFLTFAATGGYQASIGNEWASSMCKAKVSEIIEEYLNVFEEVLCSKWIILNKSEEEENEVKEAFYSRGGMPGIVGCVDGTHIRIKSPGKNLMHLYHNYKGFYSVNVMAICDHNMVISYVDSRHPGRNHDAFVWEQSDAHHYFKTRYLNGKVNNWLLGDGGYKLQPYMMTPYRNPTASHEKRFNEKHCRLRNVIERCFGVLKNRFRCLIGSRGLHYSPAKVSQMINVCCALHNMCIFYKHNWPVNTMDTIEYNDVEEFDDAFQDMDAVRAIRDRIAVNL